MSKPRKLRQREQRLADADPTGNRAARRAAQRARPADRKAAGTTPRPTADGPRRDLLIGETMTTEHNPGTGAEGSPELRTDPSGLVYLPPETPEGEDPLPYAATAAVGLTPADAKGRRYAILKLGDGTVTVELRIPVASASMFGMGIAQGLAAIAAKAAAEEHGGLIVPGGKPGSLLIPSGSAVR